MNTTDVDGYLADGCGRCEHFKTPACKVHRWGDELRALRSIVGESELVEALKWGAPCYTLDGKNVAALGAFVDGCRLSFFKGALIDDPGGALVAAGPNSRHTRYLAFSSLAEVEAQREAIAELLAKAIAVERAGLRVPPAPEGELPEELASRLADDPALAAAFEALTPGRRRSHALHVAGAKQAATRARRAERCAQKILAGKGFNER